MTAATGLGADRALSQNRTFRAPPEWSKRTVALDEPVIRNRRIASDASGMMQVLLVDGTTFTLAADSEIVIGAYTYDSAAGAAKVSASVERGAVRFTGGKIGTDPVTIETRFGTLSIDNAMTDIDLGDGGGPAHFDMIFGEGMQLVRGNTVLARVFEPGYSIVPATDERRASVRKTPAAWRSAIQQRLAAPRG